MTPGNEDLRCRCGKHSATFREAKKQQKANWQIWIQESSIHPLEISLSGCILGSGLSFRVGLIDGNSIDQSSLFQTLTLSRPWKFIQLMNSLKAIYNLPFSVYSSSESRVNVEYFVQTFFV